MNVSKTPLTLALTAVLLLLRIPFGHVMAVPAQYSRLLYYVILILFFDTLALVPFANLFLGPALVAGGTLLVLDLEDVERDRPRPVEPGAEAVLTA